MLQELGRIIKEEKNKILSGNTFEGVKTGFAVLDARTGGLSNGDLIVLGGRPAMGKTAFACALIDEIGMLQNNCVVIFTLELSSQLYARRLIAQHTGISISRDVSKSEECRKKLCSLDDEINCADVYIDDNVMINIDEIINKCEHLHKRKRVSLVVVDSLQFVKGTCLESRHQEIESVLRGLKKVALQLNCPVFALSQLNRMPEMRPDHRPMMSDFRDAGAIEEIADEVMLLYRDKYYCSDSEDSFAELNVAKHKSAPTDQYYIEYEIESGRFLK